MRRKFFGIAMAAVMGLSTVTGCATTTVEEAGEAECIAEPEAKTEETTTESTEGTETAEDRYMNPKRNYQKELDRMNAAYGADTVERVLKRHHGSEFKRRRMPLLIERSLYE